MERDVLQVAVGQRIRKLRKARGWSMAQLAEAADISVQYVSEIEHGKKGMTLTKLYHMAQALDVSVGWLVSESGMQKGHSAAVLALLEEMTPLDRELAAHTLELTAALLRAMDQED